MQGLLYAVVLLLTTALAGSVAAQPNATRVRGFYRCGQVFLQWDEPEDLEGVLISEVVEDSPAEESGLEEGDVIVLIDGEEVVTVGGATRLVRELDPGDRVDIEIMRGGRKTIIPARLGEQRKSKRSRHWTWDYDDEDEDDYDDKHFSYERRGGGTGYLGVEIYDMSSELADYFGSEVGEGVLVLSVADGSPAERAGLEDGDVILEFNGRDVGSTEELTRYVRRTEPGEEVSIEYRRKRRTKVVEVEVGETPGSAMFRGLMGGMDPRKRGKVIVPNVDRMKDVYMLDPEELREDMEDLKEELEELREDLEELRDS
jgi:serine protease Do